MVLTDPDASDLVEDLAGCCFADSADLMDQLRIVIDAKRAILAEGGSPVVIETQSLLRDPAGVLGQVCERVGLDFDPAVLSWPAGPKPEDGVWAKHWYDNVHASTSFAPYVPSSRDVPEKTLAVLDQAMPLFERLAQFAIS